MSHIDWNSLDESTLIGVLSREDMISEIISVSVGRQILLPVPTNMPSSY